MECKGKLLCGVLCLLVSIEWTSVKADNDLPTVMEAIIDAMVDFRKNILDNLKMSLEYHTEQLEETKLYTERMMKKQLENVVGQIQELKAEGALKVKDLQEANKKFQEVLANVSQNLTEQLDKTKLMVEKQEKNVIDQLQVLSTEGVLKMKELQESNKKLQGDLAKATQNQTEQLEETKLMMKKQEKNIIDQIQELKRILFPTSCSDVHTNVSGAYYILPHESSEQPFKVFCVSSDNSFGGGWTVFQRRMDGSVDFNRNWTMYKHGFGDVTGEHWLGLEKLHELTRSGRHQLLVVMDAFDGASAHALYDEFKIGNEADKYKLTLGKYRGTAGDALEYHNRGFSTFDEDNGYNYAQKYKGAWWFGYSPKSHLNGEYKGTGHNSGIFWDYFKGSTSLKATKMMLRRQD